LGPGGGGSRTERVSTGPVELRRVVESLVLSVGACVVVCEGRVVLGVVLRPVGLSAAVCRLVSSAL